MSKLGAPTDVKYFFSILYNTQKVNEKDIKKLVDSQFASYTSFSPGFNPLIEYYSKEMGTSLKRVIFCSTQWSSRNHLVHYKLWATEQENQTACLAKRCLNIDVGYVAKEQVILATGKPYSHRIYLEHGVYAELVYFYQNKSYHKVPWTYPDYQDQEKIDFFNKHRK